MKLRLTCKTTQRVKTIIIKKNQENTNMRLKGRKLHTSYSGNGMSGKTQLLHNQQEKEINKIMDKKQKRAMICYSRRYMILIRAMEISLEQPQNGIQERQ
jgi:hypothetical protein